RGHPHSKLKPSHVERLQPSIPMNAGLLQQSARAFSSEVETGSREENASEQKVRAPVLILSEPETL
ncbi:hypothetical protein NP284_20070, partial [Rhodopseudomonas pseudopalustris]